MFLWRGLRLYGGLRSVVILGQDLGKMRQDAQTRQPVDQQIQDARPGDYIGYTVVGKHQFLVRVALTRKYLCNS